MIQKQEIKLLAHSDLDSNNSTERKVKEKLTVQIY